MTGEEPENQSAFKGADEKRTGEMPVPLAKAISTGAGSADGMATREWAVFALVCTVAAIARFGDLGRQSPWLDELTNWQMAAERGIGLGRAGHWLTGLCQSLGLALWDSEWGLRLYSAIFGTLAVAAGTWWMMRRGGFSCGVATGTLLALSPFGIFYSQDANHYAPIMLGGVLAVMIPDLFLGREWRKLAACAAGVIATVGFHPTGVFLCASAIASIAFCIYIYTGQKDMDPARRIMWRRWTGIIFLFLVGMSVFLGLKFLGKIWMPTQEEGRHFGLNWPFAGATLASFYGGIYHFEMPDVALGVTGIVLSIEGLWSGFRNREIQWVAFGMLVVTACVFAPFGVIQTRQYFSPRYLAGATPVALMAIALLFARENRGGLSKVAKLVAAVWCVAFAGRSLTWELERLRGSFQPSREAIAWVGERAKEGGTVLTRHSYSSLGARFLWKREGLPADSLVALSDMARSGSVSIQQAREILQTAKHPVYFLSLIEHEDFQSREFERWMKENSEVVKTFPSTATDAFVPIDWGIPVRKMKSIEGDALILPRNGADASSVFPKGHVWFAQPALEMMEGAASTYNFAFDTNRPDFFIDVKAFAKPTMRLTDDRKLEKVPPYGAGTIYFSLQIDGGAPWVATLPMDNKSYTIAILQEVSAGRHRISICFPMSEGKGTNITERLSILSVGPSEVRYERIIARRSELVAEGAPAPSDVLEWQRGQHRAQTIPLIGGGKAGFHDIATRDYGTTGLGILGLRDEVLNAKGEYGALWPAVDWLYEPVGLTALLADSERAELQERLSAVRVDQYHPRGGTVSLSPFRVYRFSDDNE
ncbi:MAG: hypothetical protein ABI579_06065 [Candidatus Sumerlaeota bacterium]